MARIEELSRWITPEDQIDLAQVQAGLPRRAQLMASAAAGGPQARYSLLFAPATHWLEQSAQGHLCADAETQNRLDCLSDGFFPAMRAFTQHYQIQSQPALTSTTGDALPFNGGVSFYLGFECAGLLEPTLAQPAFAAGRDVGFPQAAVAYHPAAIIRDHHAQVDYLVDDGSKLGADCARQLKAAYLQPVAPSAEFTLIALHAPDGALYQNQVQIVRDYLFAGDVFQVNLSHAWQFKVSAADPGYALYQALCARNPAPFAARYQHPNGEIISSSPERLMCYDRHFAHTRPIAGTRRRGADAATDQALINELRAHPKERAEHIMLIDLERNDLGRVCQPGTVEVNELMVVESYTHVHHLVSNVRGVPRSDVDMVDLLGACFPGGTITGCPKVRCLEILAELEKTGRGPYTGSIGYISNDGFCDSNILIRSLFLDNQGRGEFRTGAGIVVDSQPEQELAETWEKARGLLRALGLDDHAIAQLQAD